MPSELARVVGLSLTPVKGLRILRRERVLLERDGIPGDRRFYLLDDRGRMVNGKHHGALNEVCAELDPRRFRMSIEIDGAGAFAEDGWLGREVLIGETTIRPRGHVGRCIVTSRDPESGAVDVPTLDLLRDLRAGAATTEPLALGVWGEVLVPGEVRVGDAVSLVDDV